MQNTSTQIWKTLNDTETTKKIRGSVANHYTVDLVLIFASGFLR